MSITLETTTRDNAIAVHAIGRLRAEDYERFFPGVDNLIEEIGPIRILFELEDFHGWEAGAGWKDLKLSFKHRAGVERLAMVGDTNWESWMAKFCQPFTRAEVRFYNRSEGDDARAWIEGD
jgi:hypothetical protein